MKLLTLIIRSAILSIVRNIEESEVIINDR